MKPNLCWLGEGGGGGHSGFFGRIQARRTVQGYFLKLTLFSMKFGLFVHM